jgi:mannose-6-phosphate isomerase-like protein (cupin superfamily)
MIHNRVVTWQTARPSAAYDVLAPDGSEIRLLVGTRAGSMVHCTLGPGRVSQAVRHRTVEEMWFCISGSGQVWRRLVDHEEVVDVAPGVALSIPPGVAFQFRATGQQPLELVIATMPPWPGAHEAVPVDGPWQAVA